ncbi:TRIGALACTOSYLDIACYLGLYCEROL 1, chloroplastic-like protein [Drosera capensis]
MLLMGFDAAVFVPSNSKQGNHADDFSSSANVFSLFQKLVGTDKWMRMEERTLFQLSRQTLIGRGNLNSLFLRPLKHQSLFSMLNSTDGPVLSSVDEDSSVNNSPMLETETRFSKWSPPSYLWRGL